jgi:DNA polymerase-3 subunit epsilon
VVVVRHGRLAATARVDRRDDPMPVIASLRETAEHVPAPVPPAGAAHPEETDLLLGWLEQPGVRVVDVDGEWSCPVRGAQRVDPIAAVALDLALPRQEVAVETLATVLPLRGARTA